MLRSALAFSGGRDSLALLLRMEALWAFIDVVHVDTGDPYPAVRELVATVEAQVPHFTRLRTDAKGHRLVHGDPNNSNWSQCCYANIWKPMQDHLLVYGYRQVLRGDRADEGHLQLAMPGDVIDGLLYTFPLWTWSKQQVTKYLEQRAQLPLPYAFGAEGMPDCKTCTATDACGGHTKQLWDEHDTTKATPLMRPIAQGGGELPPVRPKQ